MPIITVEMWEGRTVEQKRKLAKAVTEAVVNSLGVSEQVVTVLMREEPRTNWSIGGKLCSD
jgi:4-oxalocrotonate tautomerase